MFWSRKFSSLAAALEVPHRAKKLYLLKSGIDAELRNIAKLRKLTVLHIGWQELNQLPVEVTELTNLKELVVLNSPIAVIPPTISHLASLRKLVFRGTDITEIPPEIGLLQQLEDLDLGNNNIHSLPRDIGNIKRLKSLNLHYNPIDSIPDELDRLDQLTFLGLTGTKFSEAKRCELTLRFEC
ncbi:leucine-rich repeat domain-containing protein [Photobacterium japonica]|uniref:leucine-rich repeat domain-containing protein n=1 Tax=Photobacterium japonica TaxID=2910235 RepID=UPI003D0AA5CA